MTISRFRNLKMLVLLAVISLASCSKGNEEAEVEALKTEVENLRTRLDAGEAADDIVSKSWDEVPEAEVASKADTLPPFGNERSKDAIAEQFESDQTRREIDSLKRQIDLDRLNREFERQDDQRKARRKELEHSLGLDHPK